MRWLGWQWGVSQCKAKRARGVQKKTWLGVGRVGVVEAEAGRGAGREQEMEFYLLIKLCEIILYNS